MPQGFRLRTSSHFPSLFPSLLFRSLSYRRSPGQISQWKVRLWDSEELVHFGTAECAVMLWLPSGGSGPFLGHVSVLSGMAVSAFLKYEPQQSMP